MSDTPSESAGPEEPTPYVPSGLRRSTYSPPPADASAPVWDDDALAAALEEQVRTYTSPITLPVLAESGVVPAPPAAAPGPAVAPEPRVESPGEAPPVTPAPSPQEPDHVAVDPYSVPQPDDDQLLRDLEGASTAEAMQRLEAELQRRAGSTGQVPIAPAVAPFFAGEPPVSPPAPGPDPEPAAATPDDDPAGRSDDSEPWNSAPPPRYAPPPLVEPAASTTAPASAGRLLPPPTDLPDVALRAELPPPPGYADDGSPVGVVSAESTPAPAAEPDPDAAAPAPPVLPPAAWEQLLAEAAPVLRAPTASTAPVADDVENDDVVDEGDRVPVADVSPFAPPPFPPPGEIPSPADEPLPAPVAAEQESAAESSAEPAIPVEADAPPLPSAATSSAPLASSTATPAADLRGPATFTVETVGAEPTPREQRVGRAARLFWLWFAANASIVSVSLGAVMIGMGMSLRQAVVAVVIGIALSFIPLGFTTLAGKWNAQPTLVLSRAAFGVGGNVLPTVLAVLVRAFWGGVLLWLLGDAVGSGLVVQHADAGLGATRWAIIAMAVALVLTATVAAFGYGLLARAQLVLSIAAGVLIVVSAVVTLPRVHLDVALTHRDGSWLLVVGGAVMVFSFIGLAWAFSGSDVARYQRPGASGGSSMLWATFGATIPPFLLIGWGALLAASDPRLAGGLATHPFSAIASVLPAWTLIPLLLAAVVGLLSGTALSVYSGGFALENLTPRLPRVTGVVVAALLALVLGALLVLLDTQARTIVTDLAITLAVPVAAWTGIFAAEMMIRQRRFHAGSLLERGGVYPVVRWPNLVGLVVISAIGYAFVTGSQQWLGWEGFGWRALRVGSGDPLASVDLGVVLALVLGILLPLVSAVRTIRRQESAQVGPLAARI